MDLNKLLEEMTRLGAPLPSVVFDAPRDEPDLCSVRAED